MVVRTNNELKNQVKNIFIEKWNTDFMISKSQIHYVDNLESFVYMKENEIKGLLTFYIKEDEMEIVSLDSFEENIGIGSLLINEAINYYKQNFLKRLWLITTNDNLNALKFYQKKNFNISEFHFNAIEKSRKLKPSIPKYGYDNIPILHEIELQYNN
ncbi:MULTISPECIES: GNAT family N-acetyltransferase [unclassified Empedobacter]|uniref:GNAT family N-acetyltransferase n=1 Tax=unclassified Empedobacter TaxID=2643773 RepID=UPI00244AF30C|nr:MULTISPECIES: GNAT family N-acetyltransferase [unclassified Empedobacter]MDH2208386.1 GNAT family N-acetyltransferase [Empedobacter sp. GD03644]